MAIIVLNSAMRPQERVVDIPTVTVGEYRYNGKPQGPTITNLDIAHIEVREQTNIDAGYYTLILRLRNKDTMTWADGSNDDKEYDYSIQQGVVSCKVSSFNVTFDEGTSEFDVTISDLVGVAPRRAIRITSGIPDDRFKASVIQGTTEYKIHFTVTDAGKEAKEWKTTIGITALGDGNCADLSGEIDVYGDYVIKATFDKATDEQLMKMVKAADAGRIDLAKDCGWAVGQERDGVCPNFTSDGVAGGSRTFRMCLLDTGTDHSYTFPNGSKPHYIVGLWFGTENVPSSEESTYKFPMGDDKSGNLSSGNTWPNTTLRSFIQSTIQGRINSANAYNGMFKKVSNVGVYDDSAKQVVYSEDYFAPPLAGELVGTSENYIASDKEPSTQFTYYKEKGLSERNGTTKFGNAEGYWTRTNAGVSGSNNKYFYIVQENWSSNTTKNWLYAIGQSSVCQLYLLGFV